MLTYPIVRKLQEHSEDVAIPDFFDFAQIPQVLLQTLSSLLGHDVLLLVGHEVVDVDEETTALGVLYGGEPVYQHLNRK